MDTHKSLLNIKDFERQIAAMKSDPKDEKFVRKFVSDMVLYCPLHVLTRMATALLEIRQEELANRGEQN